MISRTRLITLTVAVALVMALLPALPQTEAAGGVIAYGDIVSGQITHSAYFEAWEFNGTQGDRVTIAMVGDGMLDPYLGLVDAASGQALAEDDDSGGDPNAMIQMTLPATGTYVIVATRYGFEQGTTQGVYNLQLLGESGVNVGPTPPQPEQLEPGIYYMGALELATPVQNTISQDSFMHIYGVEFEQGASVVIAMMADGSPLDAYVILADQDFNILAEDDNSGTEIGGSATDAFLQFDAPYSGTYIVVATRAGASQGTTSGNYLVAAGVLEEPQQDTPISNEVSPGVFDMGSIKLDTPVSGQITANSFVHLYGFSGNASEMVTITMTGSGGLDSYLAIIDANHQVIAEDDNSGGGGNAQIAIRLPETGYYTVVATRKGLDQGTTIGNYTLQVTSGQPTAPTPGATPGVTGFGGLPGRAFEIGEETFYLRGFGASDNPDKAPPVESFLGLDQQKTLPGRTDGLQIVIDGDTVTFQ